MGRGHREEEQQQKRAKRAAKTDRRLRTAGGTATNGNTFFQNALRRVEELRQGKNDDGAGASSKR